MQALAALKVRVQNARRIIRLRPFDIATAEGRSDERHRRAALTIVTSVVCKCTTLLTLLISVPLTVRYLGAERYGMWMTVASLVTMLSSSDLGIGNGLLNMISESNGTGDSHAAERYISSAFFMLLAIAFAILIFTFSVYPYVDWKHWFNVASPIAVRESGPTMLLLITCCALCMPLGVVLRIQFGDQQGYIANLWTALGTCIGLFGVLIGIYLHAGLPWLVLAVAGAPVLSLMLNSGWLFFFHAPQLRPDVRKVCKQSTQRLLNLGVMFFVLQLAVAVGFQSDSVVIARILGADKVPVYAVSTRMFSVASVLVGLVVAPLWPAYGEAFARGDLAWLRRTLIRSVLLVVGITVPANVLMTFAGQRLLRFWVGPQVVPSFGMLVGIGISQSLMAIAVPLSTFLNGINVIREQAFWASLMAVTNISLSIYLTRRIGVPGVVYGSVISQCLFFVLPFVLLAKNKLSAATESGPPAVTSPVIVHA